MLITPPLFMEVPVPIIQESERLYIYGFQVSVLVIFSAIFDLILELFPQYGILSYTFYIT